MDVIQFHDVTGRAMVGRWPAEGTRDIRLGSQLIVEESQRAIFVREGKALDTFGPGRHTLSTQSLPLLSRILRLPFGGRSPFQAAAVFTSAQTFVDLKWGTREAVAFRDRDLDLVRLRAFGKFAVRIMNPQLFVNTLVGTQGLYETDAIESYFKDLIVARLNDLLGETMSSIFDLAALYDELAMGLRTRVAEDFRRFGIELVDLMIGAITPPAEVQSMIDQRSSMAAIGDLEAFVRFQAARALGDAARQPGGGAGAAVGAGAGMGLGMMLPQMLQGSGVPATAAPTTAAPTTGVPATAAPTTGVPAAGTAPPAGGGAAGASNEASAMTPAAFCVACGAAMPAEARFCPACGTRRAGI
ncbi:MAG: SPFH domain-containing protein [Acidobacteriota bacterium]